jgi:hypothetical protein
VGFEVLLPFDRSFGAKMDAAAKSKLENGFFPKKKTDEQKTMYTQLYMATLFLYK